MANSYDVAVIEGGHNTLVAAAVLAAKGLRLVLLNGAKWSTLLDQADQKGRRRHSNDGLTGGNIFHGAMSLDQMFWSRPVMGWARYRTPIRNLYLCGSGAHPGGGVMGAAGYNAAQVVGKDLGR